MSLQSHLNELVTKHHVLEDTLADILGSPSAKDEDILRLKRQKLQLKDRMDRLRAQIVLHEMGSGREGTSS